MNRALDSSLHLALILAVVLVGLTITFGSYGCSSTRPDFCWSNLDTLYESGMAVHCSTDVRAAFEAYIAFVDTTDAEFPFGEDWAYLTSRPFNTWRVLFYWQVDHIVNSTSTDKQKTRRLVYVDQNGVVVAPFGCI